VSTDPLERARALLDEAARERDTLRHQKTQADADAHQLRRRLERVQDQYRRLDERHAELEQRLERAEQTAEQSRRAMLDHAART
jgi:predicted nuclease with TOPRIM domain